MEIDIIESRGWTVIEPRSRRIDAAAAPAFKEAIVALVERGHTRLALDLSAVHYVDSAGLGAMVYVLKRVKDDGALVITGVNDRIRSLLEITGLDTIFRLIPSIETL